ncbi:uncharacterized protein N0V89_004556 [Didymosphaeria variabile]|uniref:O-methyltransferase C-terminal domain-containing protein n=1 Tax=Didymosphaeria variabile TaxID=1932322 RepID=A0A9W8XQS2_9PLEO|nr:uncharacterized protein N0V89_004556 [Didymosphaeria variabile]KAJ4356522.1 hypothetical protein N0V89_004556 [Didymosphaeria variabile]
MSELHPLAWSVYDIADQIDRFKESTYPENQHWIKEGDEGLEKARLTLLGDLEAMKRQLQSPEEALSDIMYFPADLASLLIIHDLNLPQLIPPSGSISYDDLVMSHNTQTGTCVEEDPLRRIISYAITKGIFREPERGRVAHSELSLLLRDSGLFELLGVSLQELLPALLRLPDAFTSPRESIEPNETAYNIAHGTDLPMYRFLQQHPERAKRFGRAMSHGRHVDNHFLQQSFAWAKYDSPGMTIVDVGGGHGNAAAFLASSTKHMRFIVQDLDHIVAAGKAMLPAELRSRVDFTAHDFFDEQPVKGADVYLLARIMLNWSEKYCLKILRALVPALKVGAKILFYEHVFDATAEYRGNHKEKW